MNRPSLFLVIVAVVAVLLGACDDERRTISRDDLPPVPDQATIVVQLSDDGFEPDSLTATVDDLIAFEITGRHGVRTQDHRIDTGTLLDGETTLVMLPEAGDYELVDTEDPSSTMTVTITEES